MGIGAPELVLLLLVPFIVFGIIFIILRQLLLWYWKVNVIVENQEKQAIIMQQQIELTIQQNELLKDLKAQMGNPKKDPNSNI